MKDITLVIMAAGIGSRYGGGIKQLALVGPNDEIIIDYSVFDAVEAGFNKVVFIIRKDIEQDFKRIIGDRIEKKVRVEYVFQALDDIPNGFSVPESRIKPWGTGQAVLCCKGLVNEPFAIINADDYYGKSAFKMLYAYLAQSDKNGPLDCCMAGFVLKNTLCDNGNVTRGICRVENGSLLSVRETYGILRGDDGCVKDKDDRIIDENSCVSMNMWGVMPAIFAELEERFKLFLAERGDDIKAEFLLPTVIDDLVRSGRARVTVLDTNDVWYGVTYHEDRQTVSSAIKQMHLDKKYPAKLW